jgi:hypothetical protein
MVNQDFESAPMGSRVVRATALAVSIALLMMVAEFGFGIVMFERHTMQAARLLPVTILPVVVLLALIVKFYSDRSSTSRFRIVNNDLLLGRKRYPIGGLTEVARDPEIMRRAFKMMGNGGLGAIRGRYWSKRVGKFEAFLTGTENAVVLRWPGKTVAVSPADPEFFMLTVRDAAGLQAADSNSRPGNG